MLSIHCKIALFFFISLFGLSAILKISQRRACALRGVSGCVHLEPRKQMFVALGKEFDMVNFGTKLFYGYCSFCDIIIPFPV